MKEKINPNNIQDYTEPTWFLGTNLIDDESNDDLYLMEKGICTRFLRVEGAIYSTNDLFLYEYKSNGYSSYFIEIIKEAKKRGYNWVFFDRDIDTTIKP
jgi:hypothetical protein